MTKPYKLQQQQKRLIHIQLLLTFGHLDPMVQDERSEGRQSYRSPSRGQPIRLCRLDITLPYDVAFSADMPLAGLTK